MAPQDIARVDDAVSAAMALLAAGRADEALAKLRALPPSARERPACQRALGLALWRTGDIAAALGCLRKACELAPRDAAAWATLGEALVAARLPGEGEAAYRSALALEPGMTSAAAALGDLLIARGQAKEAAEVLAPLAKSARADYAVMATYGAALKAAGDKPGSIEALRRAAGLAPAPARAAAQHNLASVLAEETRFAESEQAIRAALAGGMDAPESWLVLARSLQGLDRYDEAEAAFREAIRRRPSFTAAHSELAQLIWMRTEDPRLACSDFDAALAAHPASTVLWRAKARALLSMGDHPGAYVIAGERLKSEPDNIALLIEAAQIAERFDGALAAAHAQRALDLSPGNEAAPNTLCRALIIAGRAPEAAAVAQGILARRPDDQEALALLATSYGLMGDPRRGDLYDYDHLLGELTMETPPGWSSLDAYLADLTGTLARMHGLRGNPYLGSIKQGARTQQTLLHASDPVLRAFFAAIEGPIRRHVAALGPGEDPVRRRNLGGFRFEGAWSTRLRPGGYHVNHIHPRGWLSSACYIALPKAVDRGKEGWIGFGQSGLSLPGEAPPERYARPAPGRIVLFPSYMWHGTVPFSGDEPRLSIAFDLLPAPASG